MASGEDHNRAKLTDRQIEKLRQRYATQRISQAELARQYGVTANYVCQILNNHKRVILKLDLKEGW